jgi:hypothetical protein
MLGSGAKRVPWVLIAVLAAQACNDGVDAPATSSTPPSLELARRPRPVVGNL